MPRSSRGDSRYHEDVPGGEIPTEHARIPEREHLSDADQVQHAVFLVRISSAFIPLPDFRTLQDYRGLNRRGHMLLRCESGFEYPFVSEFLL